MGTFQVSLDVGDPQGQSYESIEALVDTGATYTTLPASFLRGLGVTPMTRGSFTLADGRQIEMGLGQTWVRLDGSAFIVPVVFGDEASQPLLGAVTLEIFRLGVDPVERWLIPVHGLLMAAIGTKSMPITSALRGQG